ncbi:Capsular polysaccharide biosynthesis protein [Chryseobacterium carnipullorum]|uniref:Capsular polysaccharide biosynthesis protein n=1 Tax=Chryseobacterium carnipullorum TaxID=1124835 RepID=A0A376EUF7_CHRCU|nr:gliding motility protein [Chryseobacterium carnipullorum]STD14679.1 Capsular polysaccharide biosynthesis protein [Chryseobacterium carnipullorum]
MIPEKDTKVGKSEPQKDKYGSFALFDIEHFVRRILKNWYWFVLMLFIGYVISWVYSKYYAQSIYASNLSLSISNNTSSYFTPNQSINFIWGQNGNQDGVYLKKMLLSRSHNEFLVKELDLFVNYSTKGIIKSTYIDKTDSPIFLQIDKKHLQQINYPITLIPKGGDSYEVVLPEEGQSTSLYSYESEGFQSINAYAKPANKIIKINEWYNSPNLRFRLLRNTETPKIKVDNIIVTLGSVNQSVNDIVSTIGVEFDKEIGTIMIINKRGFNLNSTVNFLNKSVAELQKKRLADKNIVNKNTDLYLQNNVDNIRKKLDSSAAVLNYLKTSEKLYNIKDRDEKSLDKIKELEGRKADIVSKISSLNNIKNTLQAQDFEKMISTNAAGFEDGFFSASVTELKALYAKKREMAMIYKPNSEPIREINRLIDEAKAGSSGSLRNYYTKYYDEINKIDQQVAEANIDLNSYPEKERKYLDAERGYSMIEATYNSLLGRQNEAQMKVATNQSDITVIDPAKNLGQAPIGPNVKAIKMGIMTGLLLLPFLFILIGEVLDNKIRNIKELLSATKIPLLGVIGNNSNENMLTVLEHPKSSVSEAFRGIRASMRFLMENNREDGKGENDFGYFIHRRRRENIYFYQPSFRNRVKRQKDHPAWNGLEKT